MTIGIFDVIDSILRKKAATVTLRRYTSGDNVKAVWEALAEVVASDLLNKVAVSVHQFGVFTLVAEEDGCYKRPLLRLAEGFKTDYHVHEVHQTSLGAQSLPVQRIDMSRIAAKANLSEDIASEMLRDVWVCIGEHITCGDEVQVAFKGLGQFICRNSKAWMQFSPSLTNRLLDRAAERGAGEQTESIRLAAQAAASQAQKPPPQPLPQTSLRPGSGAVPPTAPPTAPPASENSVGRQRPRRKHHVAQAKSDAVSGGVRPVPPESKPPASDGTSAHARIAGRRSGSTVISHQHDSLRVQSPSTSSDADTFATAGLRGASVGPHSSSGEDVVKPRPRRRVRVEGSDSNNDQSGSATLTGADWQARVSPDGDSIIEHHVPHPPPPRPAVANSRRSGGSGAQSPSKPRLPAAGTGKGNSKTPSDFSDSVDGDGLVLRHTPSLGRRRGQQQQQQQQQQQPAGDLMDSDGYVPTALMNSHPGGGYSVSGEAMSITLSRTSQRQISPSPRGGSRLPRSNASQTARITPTSIMQPLNASGNNGVGSSRKGAVSNGESLLSAATERQSHDRSPPPVLADGYEGDYYARKTANAYNFGGGETPNGGGGRRSSRRSQGGSPSKHRPSPGPQYARPSPAPAGGFGRQDDSIDRGMGLPADLLSPPKGGKVSPPRMRRQGSSQLPMVDGGSHHKNSGPPGSGITPTLTGSTSYEKRNSRSTYPASSSEKRHGGSHYSPSKEPLRDHLNDAQHHDQYHMPSLPRGSYRGSHHDVSPTFEGTHGDAAHHGDGIHSGSKLGDSYHDDRARGSSRGGHEDTLSQLPPPRYQDLEHFLVAIGMSKYIENFRKEEIELDVLCDMTDQDMKDIGISTKGARMRIIKSISGSRFDLPAL